MSRGNSLPFPYGETYWGGDATLISSAVDSHLEGSEFEVADKRYGTNAKLRLRVVRNKSGGRLQSARGVRFTTASDGLGRKIAGYVATQGGLGFPVDDQLATSVANNDLFYIITQGPVSCRAATATTAATALAVAQIVSFTTGGLITKSAAGRRDLGTLSEPTAVTAGVTGNRRVRVQVGVPFASLQ